MKKLEPLKFFAPPGEFAVGEHVALPYGRFRITKAEGGEYEAVYIPDGKRHNERESARVLAQIARHERFSVACLGARP